MLSSKDVMERHGISRATLNNYIALGLLPRPQVRPAAEDDERAPRLGYFPASVLDRLDEIDRLKRQGVSMREIVARLAGTGQPAQPATVIPLRDTRPAPPPLSIEHVPYPAYLVNNRFEVEWANEAAERDILGQPGGLPPDIRQRSVFTMLAVSEGLAGSPSREAILSFHLALAKNRLSKTAIFAGEHLEGEARRELEDMFDAAAAVRSAGILDTEVSVTAGPCRLYATFFREGVLFAYVPLEAASDDLIAWLSRRDLVIRDILRRRRPYLTPLAVLVADLQDSVKTCAELPAEEYFELINDVWCRMGRNLRRYYATHGKHVGDGVVYYFFPQPDSNYVMNALACAAEMRELMAELSRDWKRRKNWLNDLKLNIAIDEGEEWFGTFQADTHIEFTVLGDTINRAARLSELARHGSLWVTKNTLGKLDARERARVRFGIRRSAEGGETMVPATYSRVANLLDLGNPRHEKLKDIAMLPVAEVFDLVAEEPARRAT